MENKPFVLFMEDFQYMLVEDIDFDYDIRFPMIFSGKLFQISDVTGESIFLGEHEAQFSLNMHAVWDKEEI